MTDEVGMVLENAMQEWDVAQEKNDISSFKNAAGLFLLGIKKAGKPLPRIYSFLAMLYYDLSMCYAEKQNASNMKEATNSAIKYSDVALQHEPLEFRAQLIKTYIAADNLKYFTGGLSSLIPESRGVSAIFEVAGRAIGTGVAASRVSMSKSNFRKELEHLISIYSEFSEKYVMPATEFLFFANKLLLIAEFCAENNLFGAKEIYTGVSNVNLDELDYNGLDPEIQPEISQELVRFKTTAEARLMTL